MVLGRDQTQIAASENEDVRKLNVFKKISRRSHFAKANAKIA